MDKLIIFLLVIAFPVAVIASIVAANATRPKLNIDTEYLVKFLRKCPPPEYRQGNCQMEEIFFPYWDDNKLIFPECFDYEQPTNK